MAEVPKSQLPQDPDYWEHLARRICRDASGPLAAYAAAQDVWYGVLGRRAPWLVAGSAVAMLILWLALPTPDSSVAVLWMERSLAPNEIAGTLIGGPEPPSVEALMVEFPPALLEEGQQ
jgi:hypothetical protein